jgi:ketosteroid isomerase-like protein
MSQENVEIVKRALAEFQRGNFWVPEFFEPDVRIRWVDAVGAPSETVGLRDMGDFMLNWLETFDQMSMVAERVLDAGDQVVVIAAWHGRGKASGVDTEWRQGTVWTLREGRVASVIGYGEPSDALEAAGLSE